MQTSYRKRIQKDKTPDEPNLKIQKLHLKRKHKKKICYICSLPNDILEKIVSYIPYWHITRLRKSCKLMRSICDSVLLHKFQAAIFHFSRKNPNGLEYTALMAIKDATWPYVTNGFASIFCGTILPTIWKCDTFSPEFDKITSFLKRFYNMVDENCSPSNSQFSRLLYCITLMGLLKKFKNSHLLSSAKIYPNYWLFALELRGPWVGVLWSPKTAAEPHERAKLLIMLCEIIIADRTNRAFKKVWECDSEIFVFGNDASEKAEFSKNPTSVFTFKISAPKKIISLLKSCLEEEAVQLPQSLPKGEFLVSIDISCKEAVKWGCCQVHHIEVGPMMPIDACIEDEPDENEDAILN